MFDMGRSGGVASLVMAACYVAGFAIFAGLLDRTGYDGMAGELAFTLDNLTVIAAAMSLIYLVFAAALVVLAESLRTTFELAQAELSRLSHAFAIIWATLLMGCGMIALVGLQSVADLAGSEPDRAATVLATLGIVQNGLGGGIECVGGVWSILVGWMLLRLQAGPRMLGWLAVVIGVCGIATVAAPLRELSALFGVAQIIWFAWLGIHLLQRARTYGTA